MTVFTIETLNALGARLFDHADSITNVAAHQMEQDLRAAARVCDWAAHVRFMLADLAADCDAATAIKLQELIGGRRHGNAHSIRGNGGRLRAPFRLSYLV